jgi:hypothetical protein
MAAATMESHLHSDKFIIPVPCKTSSTPSIKP